MAGNDLFSLDRLGFLTVVEHPQHGFFGGFLVLNRLGRPLEFHCTTPVKPNRAQQILYGATLRSYLFGEQIGLTLFQKSSPEPVVVLVDLPDLMALRGLCGVPLALVLGNSAATGECERQLGLGRNRLELVPGCEEDRRLLEQRLAGLNDHLDLAEPFERIRQAIEETSAQTIPAARAA